MVVILSSEKDCIHRADDDTDTAALRKEKERNGKERGRERESCNERLKLRQYSSIGSLATLFVRCERSKGEREYKRDFWKNN